jgi:hypothetical protein
MGIVASSPHELVVRTGFTAGGARRAGPLADGDIVVESSLRVRCLPALQCLRTIGVYRVAVKPFRDVAGTDIVLKDMTLTRVEIPEGAQETHTPVQTQFARMVGRSGTQQAVLSHVAGLLDAEAKTLEAGYPVLADPGVFGNGNVELIATSLVNSVALVLHMIDATPREAATLFDNLNDTRMVVSFVLAVLGGGCVYNLGGQARFDSRGPVDDMLGIRKDCDGMATSTCTAVAALLGHAQAVVDELAGRSADRAELRAVAAMVVAYLWATTATAGMAFLKARTPGFGDGHSDLDRTVHDTKACIKPFGHAVAVLVPLAAEPEPLKTPSYAKALTLRSRVPLVIESTAAMADRLVAPTPPTGLVKLMPNADGAYSNTAAEFGTLLKTGAATLRTPAGKSVAATWDADAVGGPVLAGSYKMCRPYYEGSYMELWALYTGDALVARSSFAEQPFHTALRAAAAPRARLLTRSLEHGYERQPCGTVTPHMAALASARTRRLHPGHPPGKLVELGPLPRRAADNAFVVTLSPFDADHIAKAPADRLFAIDALNYALINVPHAGYDRFASAAPASWLATLRKTYPALRKVSAEDFEQLLEAVRADGKPFTETNAVARLDTKLAMHTLRTKGMSVEFLLEHEDVWLELHRQASGDFSKFLALVQTAITRLRNAPGAGPGYAEASREEILVKGMGKGFAHHI